MFTKDSLLHSLQRAFKVEQTSFRPRDEELQRIVERLAIELNQEEYTLGALTQFQAYVGGKERNLYRASLLDRAVLFSIAAQLSEQLESQLAPSCHSYRRGRSASTVLRLLVRATVKHRRAHPNPRDRGLFVVRTDISHYGESIPVDDDSPLWDLLDSVLKDPLLIRWVRQAIVQPVIQGDGQIQRLARGTPTGSPIQPPINNLYLSKLDHALSSLEGGFYARFGDDMLLMHPERGVCEEAFRILEQGCVELGLSLRPEKTTKIFFNGAGRQGEGGYRGSPHIDYLGGRVHFLKGVCPQPKKLKELLTGVKRRVINVSAAQIGIEPEERGRALCDLVRRSLDPHEALADANAVELLHWGADHHARNEIRRSLQLLIAESLAQRRGRRAFRQFPPRLLRAWGFPPIGLSQGATR